MLVASAQRPLSIKLQISMETGLRPVELMRLKVKDIDLDHNTVNADDSQRRQPKNHKNVQQPENINRTIHKRNKLAPNDRLFNGTGALRKQIPQNEKQTRTKNERPYNPINKTLRLQTLLLHQNTTDSETHSLPMGQMGHTKLDNNPTIHAPRKPRTRRMDLQRGQQQKRRSHDPNRRRFPRIPIRHDNRWNTTIQETQMTPPPLFTGSARVLAL